MTDYARILRVLTDGAVDFVLIGGVAANLHGVDVVYSRARVNISKLVKCLAPQLLLENRRKREQSTGA